ncbi:alpha-tocopherol transfer protein-like isoform X1 [Helicoverpa zea]|uniref:alpha-tocopherol transfer protein-like isoform X1 n=2 Tax=Helicoverpa zea TaxID=7113 RepID=UPI001F55D97E|nr:alpha-tocopherol transfer protein-like isoform X1 [Helicoverpa zea]
MMSQADMPTPDYSVDLDLGEPPPELVEYARQHLGEDPNTRLQAIYELREMIYERGECTPHRMDDDFLIKFLRARKFIPKRAHRLLVNYYQFKEDNPELFENVFPLDLRKIGDSNVIAVPPYRDQEGRRLLFYRIGCWNPKAIPVEDLFKATIIALELGLMEQRSQILGGIAVFDLENIGTQHAWQITPSVAAKIVKLMVSCFPVTTHAIHIINHSWLFDKIYNIFKPLLNSNMRSRIYFHGHDNSSLHKHIHPNHLPERYGGTWPDYSYTIWLNSLKKNFEVAKQVLDYGYKFREEEVDPEVVRQLKENGFKLY